MTKLSKLPHPLTYRDMLAGCIRVLREELNITAAEEERGAQEIYRTAIHLECSHALTAVGVFTSIADKIAQEVEHKTKPHEA